MRSYRLAVALALAFAALLHFAQPSEASEWYAAIEDTAQGPFTTEDLRAQELPPDTLVWRAGEAEWAPLGSFAELQAPLQAPAGPPPLPGASTTTVDEREYFLDESGSASAPLTRDEVAARLADGRATPETLVWFDGMAEWTPLSETPLAGLLLSPSSATAAPAPATPTVKAAAPDPQNLLPGRWHAELHEQIDGMGQPIVLTIQFEFGQSGDFTGNASTRLDLSAQGMFEPVDMELTLQGRWSARPLDSNRFELHTQGSQVVRLPALQVEEREEMNDYSTFDILDPNTLRDEDGTVMRRM